MYCMTGYSSAVVNLLYKIMYVAVSYVAVHLLQPSVNIAQKSLLYSVIILCSPFCELKRFGINLFGRFLLFHTIC